MWIGKLRVDVYLALAKNGWKLKDTIIRDDEGILEIEKMKETEEVDCQQLLRIIEGVTPEEVMEEPDPNEDEMIIVKTAEQAHRRDLWQALGKDLPWD